MLNTVLVQFLLIKILKTAAESMIDEAPVDTKDTIVFNQTINWDDTGPISIDRGLEFPKWIDEWTAPAEIRKWFPFYLAGNDVKGSPVFVTEYGNWNFAEALANGDGGREKVKEKFLKYVEQSFYTVLRHGVANSSQGVVLICDWNGFSLARYVDPMAIELALRQMTMLDRIYRVINYAFLINGNFAAENFLRIAKPFIGTFLEKCEVFGTRKDKWLPYIARKIPSNQLPPWFGGTNDWKPVWLGGTPPVHLGNSTAIS